MKKHIKGGVSKLNTKMLYCLIFIAILIMTSVLFYVGHAHAYYTDIGSFRPQFAPLFDLTRRLGQRVSPLHGATEYAQYRNSREASLTDPENLSDKGQYAYNVTVRVSGTGYVRIDIQEFLYNRKTSGGSSFLVRRAAGTLCTMNDNFDGSYRGYCPAITGTGCLPLSIQRQSIKYAVYRRRTMTLDLYDSVVYKSFVCVQEPPTETQLFTDRRRAVVTWSSRDQLTARITHHYGQPVRLMSGDDICRRLTSKYEYVTAMGGARTGLHYQYLVGECFDSRTATLRLRPNYFELSNVGFINATHAKDYARLLDEWAVHVNKSKRVLFVMEAADDDRRAHDLTFIMETLVPRFFKQVESLLNRGVATFVLVIATPPSEGNASSARNNYVISAFNYLLHRGVERLKETYQNLAYFDLFNALLPWKQYHVICDDHYKCSDQSAKTFYNIDIQVFHLMMTKYLV